MEGVFGIETGIITVPDTRLSAVCHKQTVKTLPPRVLRSFRPSSFLRVERPAIKRAEAGDGDATRLSLKAAMGMATKEHKEHKERIFCS